MTSSGTGLGGQSDPAANYGIFDGFAEYRTPSAEDFRRLFDTGMVVVDTNVLLTLYRSNQRTRDDLLTVLERLGERLWVPHQVLVEFWRNRENPSVLGHHRARAREAHAALSKAGRSANDALDRWLKQVHVGDEAEISATIAEHRHQLDEVLRSIQSLIAGQADGDALAGASDTNIDPVLARLERIFAGRVGLSLPPEQHEAAVREAKRRGEAEEPPGYEDFTNKPEDLAIGDYLVWEQILVEGSQRSCEVLLVTGDSKEDWWRLRDGDVPARPRTELVREMLQRTGYRLFMVQPSGLLERAQSVLDLQVESASVRDLEQLQTATPDGEAEWTSESLEALVGLLLDQAEVQALAFLEAARNDGFVSRANVYRIGGYEETRMLRGFTRPVKTAARRLEQQGMTVGDADRLFVAVYDSEFDAVSASGFRIAPEAVPLLRPIAAKFLGDPPAESAPAPPDPTAALGTPPGAERRWALVTSSVSPVHHEPSAREDPLKHKYRGDRVELFTALTPREGWLAVRTPADRPGYKWMPAVDLQPVP